ncbi:TAP-like protein-domain-containing protein [Mycena maculata]|uniref:TAP-like protein-domain-containing protein n=1 Tax=Mycena maculata TaxID=230809 RepID=A0AAD7HIK6_9AGAR|nr:TAP-like protein-domain-containing protein [Mycena maculata]
MYPVEKREESTTKRPFRTPRSRLIFLVAIFGASLWHIGPPSRGFVPWIDNLSSPHPLGRSVQENAHLQWTPCPDNSTFYCSFFAVPLDYATPSSEDKTVIAMRMYPATVSGSERLGSIFTNPGGPGGSGHSGLLRTGPLLSNIFEGKFDIVSWDPRGVNMTTPRISCHPTNFHRELYALSHDSGDLDFNGADIATLNKSLLTTSARAKLLTEMCRDAVGDTLLRSVTTVNVARDLEEMRKAVGGGGLHYWGFSYGTTLGATYVAMFPEHSDKVVLDGVVYAPEQYTSLVDHGLSAGKSTNGVFDGFVSNCVSAGPERCALMKGTDTTAAELSARIWGLASRLAITPLPVPRPTAGMPTILHRGHLLGALFSALYRPASWAALAEAIARTEDGEGAALAELSGAGGAHWAEHARNITDAERAEEAGWGPGREMGASEGGMAVSCGDAPPFDVDGDLAVWTGAWLGWRDQLAALNPLGGPNWFSSVVRCRHWGSVLPSPPRYEGSWELGGDSRKPKNPVVFVSNSYDPITPIASGRRMVETFGKENARLLHNNGYGHCSTNHPSVCVAKALKAYMINGTLFEEGTVCEPDEGIMFPPKDSEGGMHAVGYSDEDRELAHTLRLLADAGIGIVPPGLGRTGFLSSHSAVPRIMLHPLLIAHV